jgi:hypothetical protein
VNDALPALREKIRAQVKEYAEISLAQQEFVAGESVVPVYRGRFSIPTT